MSGINEACRDIVNSVDGALGCGVIDLSTGLLLGVSHKVAYFTQSYLDAVAAASVDMMRGKTVRAVESLMTNTRGSKVENSIKEIQISTDNTYHFATIIPTKPNALVVLVTNAKVNLGMGWAGLLNNLEKIAPFCP